MCLILGSNLLKVLIRAKALRGSHHPGPSPLEVGLNINRMCLSSTYHWTVPSDHLNHLTIALDSMCKWSGP